MNPDPNEIHFDCPKCNRPMSGDKALLGEMINCPDCNESFVPTPRKPTRFARKPTATRAEQIRNQAAVFTAVASVFCVIGLFIAVSAWAERIGDDKSGGNSFLVGASLIGVSIWLYLIAQIIHIRANTEK